MSFVRRYVLKDFLADLPCSWIHFSWQLLSTTSDGSKALYVTASLPFVTAFILLHPSSAVCC